MRSSEFIEQVCTTVANLPEKGDRQLQFTPNHKDIFAFGTVPPNSPEHVDPKIVVIADFRTEEITRTLPLNWAPTFHDAMEK